MAKHRKSRKGVTMPRSKASATAVTRKVTAGALALLIGAGVVPSVLAPAVSAAPTGQGFTLNAGDMRFILKQIKIAENNATKEDAQGNDVPGQPLLGNGPNQIASPLLPYGLRTVDGTDNNLVAGQSGYGSASREFPGCRTRNGALRPAGRATSPSTLTSLTTARASSATSLWTRPQPTRLP